MKNDKPLKGLPGNLSEEYRQLIKNGLNNWLSIKELRDKELIKIAGSSNATERNLRRIRGMAILICELDISQDEAALLLHAGVPSTIALAKLSPQELVKKTGRLEIQLMSSRKPCVNLKKANRAYKCFKSNQAYD